MGTVLCMRLTRPRAGLKQLNIREVDLCFEWLTRPQPAGLKHKTSGVDHDNERLGSKGGCPRAGLKLRVQHVLQRQVLGLTRPLPAGGIETCGLEHISSDNCKTQEAAARGRD